MGQPEIQEFRDVEDKWRWRMVAGNGMILADGAESYVKRATMRKTLRKVKVAFEQAEVPE